jgi:release factor glutamine methyltransferase
MKLKDLRNFFFKQLNDFSKSEINTFFKLLSEDILGIKPYQIITNAENKVLDSDLDLFFDAINRLKLNEPIQYIMGYSYFFGNKFKLSPSVLIPRPETEELISWIFTHYKPCEKLKILELGTGSGCIAITLAKHFINSKVFALDISDHALEVARFNSESNNTNVVFFKADILNLDVLDEKYDIIVSNPPYVSKSEISKMSANVLDYEPHLALFVEDSNPLIFYKSIKKIILSNLSPNGHCFLEINESYGDELMQLYEDLSFDSIALKKDIFNKNRMIKIKKK